MKKDDWKDMIRVRIVSRRQELGLTQTQLAEVCGLTQASVSHLESGKHALSAETLRKLALGLGVSTDWLLGMEKNNKL